jgi:hypothetical protein
VTTLTDPIIVKSIQTFWTTFLASVTFLSLHAFLKPLDHEVFPANCPFPSNLIAFDEKQEKYMSAPNELTAQDLHQARKAVSFPVKQLTHLIYNGPQYLEKRQRY